VVRDPGNNQRILENAQQRLRALGIHHVTVQMEKDLTCD
jgi:Co/Zn/Cd efflux system component